MHHQIPLQTLGDDGPRMAAAVSSCVHCGFCLPACPTYRVLGEEMDSPRGRIVLMKEVLEGALRLDEAAQHLDRCLGCLACETACPSGVRYRDLIEPMRARLADARGPVDRARTSWLLRVMESPSTFRVTVRLGQAARIASAVLPPRLRAMLALLPASLPARVQPPPVVAAVGARRGRVALVTGCVQSVLRPGISSAACRVLASTGVEVIAPPEQGCCGALAAHSGDAARGEAHRAAHRRTFPADVDAILVTAAGCGSWMKGLAAQGPPVLDFTEYLDQIGLRTPPRLGAPITVAYQDACHLAHAQQITAAPRRLVQSVGQAILVPVADAGLCCGSAGLYNIEQPALAAELGARKAAALRATGASVVVTANIGCLTQLDAALSAGPPAPAVLHVAEFLDMALSGDAGRQ